MRLPSLLFLVAMSSTTQRLEPGQLYLTVTNLRNNHGYVRVCLYQSSEGFPSQPEQAYRIAKAKIQQGICELTFCNLPSGEYAVALIHDENDSEKIDKNVLGIPQEGYGVSNNAGSKFGSPKFKHAKFALGTIGMKMEIKVRYF